MVAASRRLLGALLALWSAAGCAQSAAHASLPARFERTAGGSILLDGRLDEPAWKGAPVLEDFFEIYPKALVHPRAATHARFLYDDRALYIGFHMDEPEPAGLRTPFVERDQVNDDEDYIQVYIDGDGTGRSAQLFRVNVRGIQADGYYNEATGIEDDAPDFRWQVATSQDGRGWSAEFRIPFSTLRYTADGTRWKLLLYRGRPRTDTVEDASAPIPRDASCFICFFDPVQGLVPPAPRNVLLVTPEAVIHAGPPVDGFKPSVGVTAKWQIGDAHVLDFTINPDFSEVEADAIQVTGNARYAQSLPEKRPFFMEGADLLTVQPPLDRPLLPIYTRSIADPDAGLRLTERSPSHDYAVLVARDSGGGSLLLPGPFSTAEAPLDQPSDALLARYARNLGKLTLGAVLTDRDYADGGFNRVAGIDMNWHPTASDNINAQWLDGVTHDVAGSAAASFGSTPQQNGSATYVKWDHLGGQWAWNALVQQVDDGFRADLGFVPAAGFQEGMAGIGRRWFDLGPFSELRPTLTMQEVRALTGGETIVRSVYPGLNIAGPSGLYGNIELHLAEHARGEANRPLRAYHFLRVNLGADPSNFVPRMALSGDIGQQLDLVTGQVRPGGALSLETKLRPNDRFDVDMLMTHAWLRAQPEDLTARALLLDQRGVQVTATWHLSVADEWRLQGYRQTNAAVATATTHTSELSLLFLHRASWRSAWYVGVSRNNDPAFPNQGGWEVLSKWTYTYGDPTNARGS